MKKIIYLFGILLTLTFSYSLANEIPQISQGTKISTNENYECKYGQCIATAKSTGDRCKHCVSKSGDQYCWQHD